MSRSVAAVVGRQRDGTRSALEPVAPIGKQILQPLAGEMTPLPRRVIGILQAKLRQWRFSASLKCRIEGKQVAFENAAGPRVDDDVMLNAKQRAFRIVQLYQQHPNKRTALQVESHARLLAHEAPCF